MSDAIKIAVISIICFVATVLSILSLVQLYKKGHLKSSFGVICAADILILLGFMLEYSVATILALLSFESISSNLGYLCFFLSSTTIFFQVLKSLNRLCAILFYWKYSSIFSYKNTIIFIILIFAANILLILPYFFGECQPKYILEYFTWPTSPEKCQLPSWIESHLYLFFLPFAVILNVISSARFCCKKKNATQQQKLSKIEKRYLYQTCTTSVVTTFFCIFFSFIAAIFESTDFTNFFFMCFGTLLYCASNELLIYASLINSKKQNSTTSLTVIKQTKVTTVGWT